MDSGISEGCSLTAFTQYFKDWRIPTRKTRGGMSVRLYLGLYGRRTCYFSYTGDGLLLVRVKIATLSGNLAPHVFALLKSFSGDDIKLSDNGRAWLYLEYPSDVFEDHPEIEAFIEWLDETIMFHESLIERVHLHGRVDRERLLSSTLFLESRSVS
jgi:hypothetical protein